MERLSEGRLAEIRERACNAYLDDVDTLLAEIVSLRRESDGLKQERDAAHERHMALCTTLDAILDSAGVHDPRADIREGDVVNGGFIEQRVRLLVLERDKALAFALAMRQAVSATVCQERGTHWYLSEEDVCCVCGAPRKQVHQWSSAPPTAPGWYRWRVGEHDPKPSMAEVRLWDNKPRAWLYVNQKATAMGNMWGEWAGPLVPPEGGES